MYSERSLAYVSADTVKRFSESGKTFVEYNAGIFGSYVKAQVVCPDGRIRKVRLTCCADSFWTIPARLSIRKTTLTGWVYEMEGEFHFNSEKW